MFKLFYQILSLTLLFFLIKYSNCNAIKHENEEDINMTKQLNNPSNSDQNDDIYQNYLLKKTNMLLEKILRNQIKNRLLNFVETSDEKGSYDDDTLLAVADDEDDRLLIEPTKRGLHVKFEMKPIRKSDGSIVWVATDKNKHYFVGK